MQNEQQVKEVTAGDSTLTLNNDLAVVLQIAKTVIAGRSPRLPVEIMLILLAKTVIFLMEERLSAGVLE